MGGDIRFQRELEPSSRLKTAGGSAIFHHPVSRVCLNLAFLLLPGGPFHVPWIPGSGLVDFEYLYSIEYNPFMITLRQTETFSRWFSSVKDRSGRIRTLSRLDRIAMGNFGDMKAVGEGVSEIRINTAPATGCISSAGRKR